MSHIRQVDTVSRHTINVLSYGISKHIVLSYRVTVGQPRLVPYCSFNLVGHHVSSSGIPWCVLAIRLMDFVNTETINEAISTCLPAARCRRGAIRRSSPSYRLQTKDPRLSSVPVYSHQLLIAPIATSLSRW